MGWPNCSRSAAYSRAASRAAWAMPTPRAAMVMRPALSVSSACLKPAPSSPSRRSAGTRSESNRSSAVGQPLSPSLSSVPSTTKPSSSSGRTTNDEMPRLPASGSVFAKTITVSATEPFEVQSFPPSMT